MTYVVHMNSCGGQLVYTRTESLPEDGSSVEVILSAIDTPELLYVQLAANLERCAFDSVFSALRDTVITVLQ